MRFNHLNNEQYKSIFEKGAKSVLLSKKAHASEVGGGVLDFIKSNANLLRDLSIYGAMAGAMGGIGYNVLKDQVTATDPKDDFNRKVRNKIRNRAVEIKHSKWMQRVRSMRDELVRGWKKMDPDTYAKKYNELVIALDEMKDTKGGLA